MQSKFNLVTLRCDTYKRIFRIAEYYSVNVYVSFCIVPVLTSRTVPSNHDACSGGTDDGVGVT